MSMRSFVKKVGRTAQKVGKAYANYQTGGMLGVAEGALRKRKVGVRQAPAASSGGWNAMLGGSLPLGDSFSSSQLVRQVRSSAVSMAPLVRRGAVAVAKRLPAIGGAVMVGEALYDAAGQYMGTKKKRRRMNPLNGRAARRAIRRIKGARKMLMAIERSLPRQKAAAPRRSYGRGPSHIDVIRQG